MRCTGHNSLPLPTALVAAVATVAAVISTPATAADKPSAENVAYFEKHIRPLLVSRCYSCHSARAKKTKGGLRLDLRSGWMTGGDTGPAIVPGDVEASLLIRAVRYKDLDLQMPPDKRLPQNTIALLERWVQMGAPDPRDGTSRDNGPSHDPADPIAGRDHWAFQPLAEVRTPPAQRTDWPRTTIDTLVLARLQAANMAPAPDADRRTLGRRVYLQLIGMPPSPQQLAAFLADDRPNALANLVDRLLTSPHFGERWGRHWLDLARYADSNGLDENFLFREAWRYRNHVIDAFNADTPYDRFLLEQIAGDLLPHASVEQRDRQRVAAGFLVVGPKVLLGNDPNERRMDVADEQLDTIGRTVLGQTLGCARCHDHKFDPIPTADYYALAGIMTSTRVMQKRYMLGSQRLMERLVGLGPQGDEANSTYERYWRERSTWQKQQKLAQTALKLLKGDDDQALTEHLKAHADAFAEQAQNTDLDIDKRVAAQQAFVKQLGKQIAEQPKIPPRAMIPADTDKPANEHIRLAGQSDQLGAEVPRGFLSVISDRKIQIADGKSGRVAFATWLTQTNGGAGHLAARVLANRVWHHLLGRGIVRTVDNFGRTGEAPTHPQLLDHLARELIRSGWSIKALIRSIVLSRTFALSSRHHPAHHAIDPENQLLWRAHRRRLDPEYLRDGMLLAAGTLNLTPMQSSVWYLGDQATAVGANKNRRRTDFPCRSVYLPVIRNDLPELFDVFDFADPHSTTGMRSETMVATQGLFLLNDESVMRAAQATANRLLADEEADDLSRVDRMFELILNARATDEERDDFVQFLSATRNRLGSKKPAEAIVQSWAMACQALFASSRYQILE